MTDCLHSTDAFSPPTIQLQSRLQFAAAARIADRDLLFAFATVNFAKKRA